MAEHSIFAGAPPWEPTTFTDGDPSIVTANAFYSVSTRWVTTGGRLRAASLPGSLTLAVRIAPYGTLVDLSTAPAASGTTTVASGWATARWDPVEIPIGSVAWISLEDAGDAYLFADTGTIDPRQAADGSDLYLAENGDPQERAAYRLGAGTTSSSAAWYGLDIIVEEPPPADVVLESTVTIGATPKGVRKPGLSAEVEISAVTMGGMNLTEEPHVQILLEVLPKAEPGYGSGTFSYWEKRPKDFGGTDNPIAVSGLKPFYYQSYPQGVTVVRMADGSFTTVPVVTEELEATEGVKIYWGGKDNPVTEEEAAELDGAGYGDYLTMYPEDAYNQGAYNEGDYGA